MIRVGLIGCGRIAQAHVPYIRGYRDAIIVGLCDADLKQAENLAQRFKIDKVYNDFERLLSEQRPDVIHILTPPQSHAKLALAAMEAGVHVLVEKPMASCLDEADRMVNTAQRTGVKLCVDHNRLFDPVVLQAKQMVARGVVGEVVGVDVFQGYFRLPRNGLPDQDAWVSQLPGGLLQNIAPHPISLLLAFMPEAKLVSVVTKQTGLSPVTPFDEVRAVVEGEHGLGLLTLSLGPQPYFNYLMIYGSLATLQINLNNNTLVFYKDRRMPKLLAKSWFNIDQSLQLLSNTMRNGLQVLTGKINFFPGIKHVIHQFYNCLENGGKSPVTAEEGRAVVELFDRICRDSESRCAFQEQQTTPRGHSGGDVLPSLMSHRPS